MTKQRLRPDDRRDQILTAAVKLAEEHGYSKITRDQIAAAAGCAPGLVSHYFATMPQLRRAIMRAAVKAVNLAVIAQGLGVGDPHAKKAPTDVKTKALKLLAA